MTLTEPTAFLLHGICRRSEQGSLAFAMHNPSDFPVVSIEAENLMAVVSPIDQEQHDIVDLFRDPEAVVTFALHHNMVLADLSQRISVLPLRLGSVMSNRTAVTDMLNARESEFSDTLSFLDGAIELGVAIDRLVGFQAGDPSQHSETANGAAPHLTVIEGGASTEGRGRAYLKSRAGSRTKARQLEGERHALTKNLLNLLQERSRDIRLLANTQADPDSGTERVVNWALLCDRDNQAEIAMLVGEAAQKASSLGLKVAITGPWPPYSFVASEGPLQ